MFYKFIFILLLVHLFQSHVASKRCKPKNRKRLIIDQDGGADDAMAIFMALLYQEYFDGPDVIALTTTYGNVGENQAYENSQRILDIANRRDVPIYRGSERSLVISYETDYYFGKDGLGDNETVIYEPIAAQKCHAAVALIELSRKYKDNLIVLSIGPLTNIALAIRLDPGFLGRISQLYVSAGTEYNEDNPDPEFNALMDVEAYHAVAGSSNPEKVTVISFGMVQSSLNVSKDWRVNVLGAIPTTTMRALNIFERVSLTQSDRWQLLDPAAAAIVLDKAMIEQEKLTNNSIILCGKERGINTNDFESSEPNMKFIYSVDKDHYKKMLLDIFGAELK